MRVKKLEDRGIVSFDQQYDAFNFVYYVERAENSYQMKPITNRLSVFINGAHGRRVFPKNIEGQLSLLLWRVNNRLKNPDGSTNQIRLGFAIKALIPRIMHAIIMEVVKGRKTALAKRTDEALRTYLLIHQVFFFSLSFFLLFFWGGWVGVLQFFIYSNHYQIVI